MPEKTIKKIGGIQKLDANGFIINNYDLKNIQAEYSVILDDVLDLMLKSSYQSA